MDNTPNLLPCDGEARYIANCFSSDESKHLFAQLLTEISWKHEPIHIFGKRVMQPRLTAWYGDAEAVYSYSGITLQPMLWTPALASIKARVESVVATGFNSALLNQYRDGRDSMGWHRDDEKELGANPVIASVSFGATRQFQLRHRADKELKRSIALTHGSLLLMQGATQHHWQHCIPKTAKPVGARINITFRMVLARS